jgi:hypothetical protein
MSTQHTPGPWEIDFDTRPVEVCTIHSLPPNEDGNTWAYVRGEIGNWDATPETNLANARLIAAAPDLLMALEHALAWNDDAEPTPSWVFEARAAIQKAEGK